MSCSAAILEARGRAATRGSADPPPPPPGGRCPSNGLHGGGGSSNGAGAWGRPGRTETPPPRPVPRAGAPGTRRPSRGPVPAAPPHPAGTGRGGTLPAALPAAPGPPGPSRSGWQFGEPGGPRGTAAPWCVRAFLGSPCRAPAARAVEKPGQRGKVKAGAGLPASLLYRDIRMEKLLHSCSAHPFLTRTDSLLGTGSSARASLPSSHFQAPEKHPALPPLD